MGAGVFLALSFTPSLLPRPWLVQGAVAGVTAVFGYGLGGLVAHALGRLPVVRSNTDVVRRVRVAVAVVVAMLLGLAVWWSEGWQADLRTLMGMPEQSPWRVLPILVTAGVVFGALLALCRIVRLGTRSLVRLFGTVLPPLFATVVAVVVAAVLVFAVIQDVLVDGTISVARSTFALVDRNTSAGIVQPASPARSGSPESLVSWDSLGRKGRDFTGGGPTVQQISEVTGQPAREPVRVYVGLQAASTPAAAADLAVRELERAGGFDRAVLVVVATTGTGWVDEHLVAGVEYLYGGDTAIVATQYSFLPSGLSFIADRSKATAAASKLLSAVRARWQEIPVGSRPRLVVVGESLGSYAVDTSVGDVDRMLAGPQAALLVGPVNSDPLWQSVTGARDTGSPVWRPVVAGGRQIRFGQQPADLQRPAAAWREPRVVYLQNASDPITWWTPSLLWSRPDWLDDPRGPDVSPRMRWYPLITFWQVSADLAYSTGVPAGHGHVYGSAVVDAWAAIAPSPLWTEQDMARVKAAVAEYEVRPSLF